MSMFGVIFVGYFRFVLCSFLNNNQRTHTKKSFKTPLQYDINASKGFPNDQHDTPKKWHKSHFGAEAKKKNINKTKQEPGNKKPTHMYTRCDNLTSQPKTNCEPPN